jgi:hypothetical protein
MASVTDERLRAEGILDVLLPRSISMSTCLERAVFLELLITALQDPERPRTVSHLLSVLERLSAGVVAATLLSAVRRSAEQQPELSLAKLASRVA